MKAVKDCWCGWRGTGASRSGDVGSLAWKERVGTDVGGS